MKSFSRSCAIAIAVLQASCQHNIIPNWVIDITGEPTNAELAAFENAARAVGFKQQPLPERGLMSFGRDEPAQMLEIWGWPEHPSTAVGLFQMVGQDKRRIVFSDSETDGFALVGAPCQKYLDFLAALKPALPVDQLSPRIPTCDVNGKLW